MNVQIYRMGKKALKKALVQDREKEARHGDQHGEYAVEDEVGHYDLDRVGDAVQAFCRYTSEYCTRMGLPMCEQLRVEDVAGLVESLIVQTETSECEYDN